MKTKTCTLFSAGFFLWLIMASQNAIAQYTPGQGMRSRIDEMRERIQQRAGEMYESKLTPTRISAVPQSLAQTVSTANLSGSWESFIKSRSKSGEVLYTNNVLILEPNGRFALLERYIPTNPSANEWLDQYLIAYGTWKLEGNTIGYTFAGSNNSHLENARLQSHVALLNQEYIGERFADGCEVIHKKSKTHVSNELNTQQERLQFWAGQESWHRAQASLPNVLGYDELTNTIFVDGGDLSPYSFVSGMSRSQTKIGTIAHRIKLLQEVQAYLRGTR